VLEGNTVFEFHDAFNPDKGRVAELRDAYAKGEVGDGAVKKELGEAINAFLEPIRERREAYMSLHGRDEEPDGTDFEPPPRSREISEFEF